MCPEFPYSTQMQIILAVVTFTESFCSMYLLSNIILETLGMSATRRQKMWFAFITGTLMQSVLAYGLYFYRGGVSFSFWLLQFVVTPSPIFGLIYCYAAHKIFKLSPARSIRLVSYIYFFWIATKTLSRIIGAIFFIQDEVRYNYLKDALQQVTYFIVFFCIYLFVMYMVRRGHIRLNLEDKMFFSMEKEIFLFFIYATFAFAIRVTPPLILTEPAIAFIMSLLILTLFIAITILLDIRAYNRQTISNHEAHISALFKGMEEMRGLKHDFNNILHTYSGYLALKEYGRLEQYHASLVSAASHAGVSVELARKMQENPAVITLLINKLEYANSKNVKLILSLRCELSDLYIDNVDVSRILSCLLDNAIEAAGESEQRKIYVSMEAKTKTSKLIIITNSTAGDIDLNAISKGGTTTKAGHSGIGLSVVHKILEKYGNSKFQMKYFDYEFSAYLELRK